MLPDPREFPPLAQAPAAFAALYAAALSSLGAATGVEADREDEAIGAVLRSMLVREDGAGLAALFAGSPSVEVSRHLSRLFARAIAWPQAEGDMVARMLFAIPVVIVAGATGDRDARVHVAAELRDAAALAGLLVEHQAFPGHRSIALADALVGADVLDSARLPALLASARLAADAPRVALPPSPIDVRPGEAAYLRFLVGSALVRAGNDLFSGASDKWLAPVSHALGRELARSGATLLALPRPVQSLATALASGRAAQREVAAQLFASSAIRRLRASYGEPSAVISAHRVAGGGEVRLSLSSAFDRRDAEGFRCRLEPTDRVDDVVRMLTDLLRDCRVTDVRLIEGLHPDRDPRTGLALLFKPETLPPGFGGTLQ